VLHERAVDDPPAAMCCRFRRTRPPPGGARGRKPRLVRSPAGRNHPGSVPALHGEALAFPRTRAAWW
jgi:hypothetical protein